MKISPRHVDRIEVWRSVSVVLGVLVCGAAAYAAGNPPVRHVTARNLLAEFAAVAADPWRPAERAFLGRASEGSRQQMRLAEVGGGHATNSDVRSHALQLATDYRELNGALEELI